MARYRGPALRLYRREGRNLYLKSERSAAARRVNDRLNTPPGQHGRAPTKMSTYGVQLREKQTTKRIYGLMERQFRRYVARAVRYRGVTGHVLLQLIERRLDNVVYRAGFALTRQQARQLVGHNHVLVNGKRVNIPSYEVRVGDVISIVEKMKANKGILESVDYNKARGIKGWIELNDEDKSARFLRIPEREELDDIQIREQLIIELYSK
ncbi:MAG: small subunit ribosomal protein [Candidatus Sumerlaeota bacterium]|nr:small subunit ribosomal protein [Candidatus Sumerlaeota bacterium]